MKKFTFILTSMLFLLVGGVFSQSVTTLYLDGGNSRTLSNQSLDGNSKVIAADVLFTQQGINEGNAGLTGTNWVASYNEGETHTFTVTLSEAPGSTNFSIYVGSPQWNFGQVGNGYEEHVVIPADKTTASISISKAYEKVYIFQTKGNNATLKISSITRTITTASSVASPTISPASGTYDGDLSVTITKGEGNDKVVYSVSGAATGNETNAEFTADSKTLTLTGTGAITVTAKGVKGTDESSEVINTYTYDSNIPSGVISVWTGNQPQQFGNDWNTSVEISNSQFSTLEVGDYIFLKVSTPHGEIPNIGFRNNWKDDDYKTYTDTKSGNVAYGNLPDGSDPYWWLKVTDATLCNLFKNGNQQVQGQNFTLEEVQIHKHVDINEGANTISKSTDMIVNLGRSFVAGTWNTVCLPFVPTSAQANTLFGSGYKLAKFAGVSGTTMQFTTIDIAAFEAGKPYLVMPKEGCATGTTVLFDVDITAKNPTPVPIDNYTFTGTFTTKTFTSADNTTSRFVASGNELVTPEENTTLKSLRCYFTVPATAPARSLSFDVDEEGNTTGVADINRETITNNGDFFNLAGQRVAQPTKGLYIVNGKKVVIK